VETAEKSISYLRSIEAVTGLTCTGLVDNTHLCGETTPEEVRRGSALAEEISRQTGLPVLCSTAEKQIADQLGNFEKPVYPITIRMKKPWER
jgi:hypothetical protein